MHADYGNQFFYFLKEIKDKCKKLSETFMVIKRNYTWRFIKGRLKFNAQDDNVVSVGLEPHFY